MRRSTTYDPVLILLNEEITSDILKHKQNLWKEHLDADWDHSHNTHILWKTVLGLSNRAPPPTLNTSITFNNKITTTSKHIVEFKDRITINAVLAFTAYSLDTGSDANVQKILNETFSLKEVKSARTTLWELCHERYLPATEWLQILPELDKGPRLVVNVSGLVPILKFLIEEINETALCEKMVRMETKITSMNSIFLQHIVVLTQR